MKGSWRDRLGINKELPKIAEEFKEPSQKSEAASGREPQDKPSPPPARAGAPLTRPAPMAPRPNAAEFAERLRQQREAAQRMAEQRVAEAKERAVNERTPTQPQAAQPRTAPPPARPASPAPKPRFGFAEEELRGARQEQPSQTSPREQPRQWTGAQPASLARPVFTADRQAAPPDPRLRAPPPRAPQARNLPPPQIHTAPPPAGRQAPRPPRPAAPQAIDRSRRTSADPARQFDEYAQDEPHLRSQRYEEMPSSRNDYRGAHSRELDYVEEESDDLFEDDQNYAPQPRRRATAQDYNNVYREFDGPVPERRRTGPFILIAALVAVGATAGGLIYFYQSSLTGQATSAENVPVVDEPSAPVKTEPESAAAPDDQAPSTEEQSASATAPEIQAPAAAAQKKQIYDRILGETTLEEQEQVVPSEEQPVQPGEQSHGFDADPLPLPMPPSPGGGTDDQSGSLEPPQPSAAVASTKAPSEAGAQQASPVSATLSTEPAQPAVEAEAALAPPPSPSIPAPADPPAASPPPPEPVQTSNDQPAPSAPQKAPVAEKKIETELAFAEQPAATPPEPAGDGPVQIAQLPGFAAASETTTFAPSPQAVPDYAEDSSATTQRRVRTIGTRDSDKLVFNPNRNFNRAKQVQVAEIATDPVSTQSVAPVSPAAELPTQHVESAAPTPQPDTVGQQAALTPSPSSKPQVSHGAGSGFTIQLASYKSESEALAGYEELRLQHGDLVGSLTPNVQKADLGANGTFYRLHLGSFSTKEAAKKACSSLLAAGERDCIVKSR
jgi:cell division protein FtsN